MSQPEWSFIPLNLDSHPVSRLRERLREETATVILAAAEEAIGEAGLHSTRMEQIAARAGVSVGTLYNHFQDRSTLVHALFESRASKLCELLADALAAVRDRPARDQVQAMLSAMRVHARTHGRLFAALMAEHQGPIRLSAPAAPRAEMTKRAAEIVARATASGEFREAPEGIFADALVALARLVLMRSVEGRIGDADVIALTELFVRGVAR
jgi:AcrR family transcriptional regulator